MPSRANQRQNKSNRESSGGAARAASVSRSFDEAELQARLDANIAQLVEDANRGQPIWWQPIAWRWGLPMWAMSGRPFRGIAALLLWHASANHKTPLGWLEATSQDDPDAVVIPVRKKRGWAPLLITRTQRTAPLPLILTQLDFGKLDIVWNQLELENCWQLIPYLRYIRELAFAFLSSLCRAPQPPVHLAKTWIVEAMTVAPAIAAMIADAAYALAIGKHFDEDAVWLRGDIAALFPWEAQEPGGLRETLDRGLLRKPETRILARGRRAGQIPVRSHVQLNLDRVWEQGRVVPGYSAISQLLDALNLAISGDPVMDARNLGRRLAWRMARLEKLPALVSDNVAEAWQVMVKRIKYRSWIHYLPQMTFADIRFYTRRWPTDRLLPRVRAVAKQMKQIRGMTFSQLGSIPLTRIGLLRLVDAMGLQTPLEPIATDEVSKAIGAPPDTSYRRYPIYKMDGTRRWLDVPNDALAHVQRTIMATLRASNPFAGVAMAFEPGRSPAMHARMHEGAVAAVVIDIADFFGSIRPRHLRWAFHPRKERTTKTRSQSRTKARKARLLRGASRLLLAGGTYAERESILSLLFADDGQYRWLPQGAPSSPWVANLAAHPLDQRIRQWSREYGNVKYSRYADDLVLSLHEPDGMNLDATAISRFLHEAEKVMREAVEARGWQVQEKKTRRWQKHLDRTPLILCGIEVPASSGTHCKLPRESHRRARAALHRLRCGQASNHGILAWAWGATGHPGWLAWTNPKLTALAIALAGPILAEAFLSGWADSVDYDEDADNQEKLDG